MKKGTMAFPALWDPGETRVSRVKKELSVSLANLGPWINLTWK